MTTRWEYRFFSTAVDFARRDGRQIPPDQMTPERMALPVDHDGWLRALNALGHEGWEVISPVPLVVADPGGGDYHETRTFRLLLRRSLPQ